MNIVKKCVKIYIFLLTDEQVCFIIETIQGNQGAKNLLTPTSIHNKTQIFAKRPERGSEHMKLSELLNVLKTAETAEEMDVRREEIAALIPAVRTMFGYDQKNSAHQYDLWMHSLHVVCNLPRRMENDMVYLAALLHDIGKPEAQCRGKREGDPDMHYYGHPEKSMEIVRDIVIPELDRQGYVIPCFDVQELLYYVKYHDDHVSVKLKHVRRHKKMASFAMFQNLMLLQTADFHRPDKSYSPYKPPSAKSLPLPDQVHEHISR